MMFQKLYATLESMPHVGRGPAVMVIGDGAAPLVRALALEVSEAARAATVAIDLDIMRNVLRSAFEAEAVLGEPRDAQFKGHSFLRVSLANGALAPGVQHPITFRRVGFSRVLVADFDRAWLAPGARVQISPEPHYWLAARESASMTIVAAPERSRVGLAVAAHMDGVVIAVNAQADSAADTITLKQALDRARARVIGAIVTNADPVITRVERVLGQAA